MKVSEKMKKFANILFSIVLVVIAIVLTITIVEKILWKDNTPSVFGYKNFIVLSGSMEPTLNVGDIVFVKKDTDIKVDDIIAFRIENGVVTHRVIEIIEKDGEKLYKTKGDANNTADDEFIRLSDIEGKYSFKIWYIGNIILFLKTKTGIGLLIAILMLSLFLGITKKEESKEIE